MDYKTYLAKAAQQFPKSQLTLISVAPPEMLKIVATELFLSYDTDSALADETRVQLQYLRHHGKVNFDASVRTPVEAAEKPKTNKSDFA